MNQEAKEDRAILNGAQTRTTLSAYLESTPGRHNIKEVAQATGLSTAVAGKHLADMAKDKLIKSRKIGLNKMYWSGEEGTDAVITMGEERNLKSLGSNPGKPGKRTYVRRVVVMSEVEFLINGTLVVMGRNPETGRLRITLEEQ